MGLIKVELVVEIPRLQCKCCGAIRQPPLVFAKAKKHYSRSLERFVIDLCHVASIQDVATLKGSRWLLLKAPENLKSHPDPKKDERSRLQSALALNQPLAMAYHMKERLRLVFQCLDRETAQKELTAWTEEVAASAIRILKDAARKLLAWKPFILNWHRHRISTGKLEAINRKIGTLQRNAYGYRDDEYLKLRIFDLHNTTYALTG